MLIPLRPGELQRLIPAVATGNQFRFSLGKPREVLQRLMVAAIGGVITLLISQSQMSSRWGPFWLVTGVVFLLYVLWGPILQAGQRNATLRRYPAAALFEGEVADVITRERIENRHEQADSRGRLELVENRRTWMLLELEDEEGYLGRVAFPMDKKHQSIRRGSLIRCLVLSERKDFSKIGALSDAWLPGLKMWVGEYPFLLRPAFEELCQLRINRR
ncbi:hypothetical protein FZZ91_07105 [Synechococcus sp. HB1133]|uniref:hypothetical protein n=1 Tax=unclassified Synechococcus TaxID=2626047 RepID=UPI00140992E4|nr:MULTISPECIES: hypothetical protein [unclassified Synechococcus]MCB4395443.1 hypothetical protein [Synechococcus sp. PH41509]MCB4422606.1 hypothetical protein [Synechococcus sp. HB1133]MCB4430431.1 hypothetical protein [Synechococcus sp. HBA1120]NHI81554.1 hypothetical protein [Synechococcus sp. HB1133]